MFGWSHFSFNVLCSLPVGLKSYSASLFLIEFFYVPPVWFLIQCSMFSRCNLSYHVLCTVGQISYSLPCFYVENCSFVHNIEWEIRSTERLGDRSPMTDLQAVFYILWCLWVTTNYTLKKVYIFPRFNFGIISDYMNKYYLCVMYRKTYNSLSSN